MATTFGYYASGWKKGHLNGSLLNRYDIPFYKESCSDISNFVISRTGVPYKRAGTRWIADSRIYDANSRTRIFEYNPTGRLEDSAIFYINTAVIALFWGDGYTQIETVALYDTNEKVDSIKVTQVGFNLIVTAAGVQPYLFKPTKSTGGGLVARESIRFTDGPYDDQIFDSISSDANGRLILTSGSQYKSFIDSVGRFVRVFLNDPTTPQWFYGEVSNITSATGNVFDFTDTTLTPNIYISVNWGDQRPNVINKTFSRYRIGIYDREGSARTYSQPTEGVDRWDLTYVTREYSGPLSSSFYQGRLVFGATPQVPNLLVMSKSGDLYNMAPTSTNLNTGVITDTTTDEDAIVLRIQQNYTGLICFMKSKAGGVSDTDVLWVYTTSGLYLVYGLNGPITPNGNAVAEYQNSVGISPTIAPIDVYGREYIVANNGFEIQTYQFEYAKQAIIPQTLSTLSSELFTPGIKDMSYAHYPDPRLIILLRDGTLVNITIDADNEVFAFSKITLNSIVGGVQAIETININDADSNIYLLNNNFTINNIIYNSLLRFAMEFQGLQTEQAYITSSGSFADSSIVVDSYYDPVARTLTFTLPNPLPKLWGKGNSVNLYVDGIFFTSFYDLTPGRHVISTGKIPPYLNIPKITLGYAYGANFVTTEVINKDERVFNNIQQSISPIYLAVKFYNSDLDYHYIFINLDGQEIQMDETIKDFKYQLSLPTGSSVKTRIYSATGSPTVISGIGMILVQKGL